MVTLRTFVNYIKDSTEASPNSLIAKSWLFYINVFLKKSTLIFNKLF